MFFIHVTSQPTYVTAATEWSEVRVSDVTASECLSSGNTRARLWPRVLCSIKTYVLRRKNRRECVNISGGMLIKRRWCICFVNWNRDRWCRILRTCVVCRREVTRSCYYTFLRKSVRSRRDVSCRVVSRLWLASNFVFSSSIKWVSRTKKCRECESNAS